MERAGDAVLKLEAEQDMGWTYVPRKLLVAQTWARNGVRLKDAVKLAEEALDEISLGPEMSDLTAPPNAASQMFGFDSSNVGRDGSHRRRLRAIEGFRQSRQHAQENAAVARL